MSISCFFHKSVCMPNLRAVHRNNVTHSWLKNKSSQSVLHYAKAFECSPTIKSKSLIFGDGKYRYFRKFYRYVKTVNSTFWSIVLVGGVFTDLAVFCECSCMIGHQKVNNPLNIIEYHKTSNLKQNSTIYKSRRMCSQISIIHQSSNLQINTIIQYVV